MKLEAFISAVIASIVLVVAFVIESMATAPLEGVIIDVGKETPVGWTMPVVYLLITFAGVFALLSAIAKKFG